MIFTVGAIVILAGLMLGISMVRSLELPKAVSKSTEIAAFTDRNSTVQSSGSDPVAVSAKIADEIRLLESLLIESTKKPANPVVGQRELVREFYMDRSRFDAVQAGNDLYGISDGLLGNGNVVPFGVKKKESVG